MIEFFLGKTGSGKSTLAVAEGVVQELRDPNVYVITNLALNLGEVNAYFARRYEGQALFPLERIRILDDKEARHFYLHREIGVDLAPVTKEEEKALEFPGFAAAASSSKYRLVYIIDEAHIFFDAREWANVGATMNFFCSQHRKLGVDRIIFITQFLRQVEMRLREHAFQFWECTNWSMKRFSFWALPKVFTVRLTYKAPPCEAEWTTKRKMDPEIFALFDTSGGVGIKGGRKPETKRAKGLPIWTVGILIAVGCVVLTFGPEAVWRKAMEKIFGGAPAVAPSESPKASGASPQPKLIGTGVTPTEPERARVDARERAREEDTVVKGPPEIVTAKPKVWPTGVLILGERWIVQLSDGSRLTERELDGDQPTFQGMRITRVNPYFIEAGGYRYHVRPSERSEKPSSASPAPLVDVKPSRLDVKPAGSVPVPVAPVVLAPSGLRPAGRPFGMSAIELEARSGMTDPIHGNIGLR